MVAVRHREPGAAYRVIGATQLRRSTWALVKVLCSGCLAFRCRSFCCWPCSGITRLDRIRPKRPAIFRGLFFIYSPVMARLDRATQYQEVPAIDREAAAYWIPACAGMTNEKLSASTRQRNSGE